MTDMTIPSIIRDQIGNAAFKMLGAKDLVGSRDALAFKIRGCRTVSHIRITLNAADLYEVEFMKYSPRKLEMKTVSKAAGMFADQLHETIESHTGLYVSL